METTSGSEVFHLYKGLTTPYGMSQTIAAKVSVSLMADGCQVDGDTCREGIHSTWERGVNNVSGYIGATS